MRVLGTQLGLLSRWLLEARSLASLSVTCRFLTCSVIAGEEAKAIAPRKKFFLADIGFLAGTGWRGIHQAFVPV